VNHVRAPGKRERRTAKGRYSVHACSSQGKLVTVYCTVDYSLQYPQGAVSTDPGTRGGGFALVLMLVLVLASSMVWTSDDGG
jgi:hypothetical protein